MFYELLSVFFGTIKILIYKLIYFKRITFESLPKMNSSFKIAIKRNSKLELAKILDAGIIYHLEYMMVEK